MLLSPEEFLQMPLSWIDNIQQKSDPTTG